MAVNLIVVHNNNLYFSVVGKLKMVAKNMMVTLKGTSQCYDYVFTDHITK